MVDGQRCKNIPTNSLFFLKLNLLLVKHSIRTPFFFLPVKKRRKGRVNNKKKFLLQKTTFLLCLTNTNAIKLRRLNAISKCTQSS